MEISDVERMLYAQDNQLFLTLDGRMRLRELANQNRREKTTKDDALEEVPEITAPEDGEEQTTVVAEAVVLNPDLEAMKQDFITYLLGRGSGIECYTTYTPLIHQQVKKIAIEDLGYEPKLANELYRYISKSPEFVKSIFSLDGSAKKLHVAYFGLEQFQDGPYAKVETALSDLRAAVQEYLKLCREKVTRIELNVGEYNELSQRYGLQDWGNRHFTNLLNYTIELEKATRTIHRSIEKIQV